MSLNSLPTVHQETVSALTGELEDQADLISSIYLRLMADQPALTEQMSYYIQGRAKTLSEVKGMAEVFVLTYRLLESQADADRMNSMLTPPGHDSLK